MVIPESPGPNFAIKTILTLKGDDFMLADDSGRFVMYEATGESKSPYKMFKATMPAALDLEENRWNKCLEEMDLYPYFLVTGMEQIGDWLVYATQKRQLLKMRIHKDKIDDFGKISFLNIPFHRQKITAVATCLMQPLLATSAMDQTVMLWSYTAHPGQLRLQHVQRLPDTIQAMALHPSGFYLLVAHFDRVQYYTVFPDGVKPGQFVPVRGCTEISFAHGGHLFAVNDEEHNVHVVRFWEAIRPFEYKFSAHTGKVKSITWLEDDTGFVTVGADSQILYWKLKPNGEANPAWVHEGKTQQFLDCEVIREESEKPNQPPKIVAIASSKDCAIREVTGKQSRARFLAGAVYSQMRMMHGRKALFCGSAEEERPGSVQVAMYPFNESSQVFRLETHGAPVSRLALNYEHSLVFSGGEDGSLALSSVID